MNLDRFKDFEPDVRNLVLSFENPTDGHRFFDVDQLEIIADYYLEVADIEGLEAAVTFGERLYPANDEIRLRRAHLWSVTGQYNQALKLLQELEKKSPRNTDICYAIGAIYSMTEQPRKAIDYYLRAAADGYELGLIYSNVADEYYKLRLLDLSVNYYRKAIKADPNDDHSLYNLACTWDEMEQLDTAVDYYKQHVSDHPFSKWGWYCLGCVYSWHTLYEQAADAFEYAIAIDPNDAEGLLSKANSLYNLENFETALSYFQKYSEKMPDDEFGFLHQGTCLINLARYDEAIAVLEKAEELADPESQYLPEVYQEMAFAYSEQGKPDTAIYYLDKTDNLDCDHINMQIIKGHVLLANKRLKEAENTFKEALKASGNSPKIMLRIIVSLYDNRYLRSSYMLLKNFFSYMDDEWKDGYAYMALCCLDMKKDDEFLYYLKLACEKNPKEARIVLGGYFPKGTEPKDYYEYMINKLKKK